MANTKVMKAVVDKYNAAKSMNINPKYLDEYGDPNPEGEALLNALHAARRIRNVIENPIDMLDLRGGELSFEFYVAFEKAVDSMEVINRFGHIDSEIDDVEAAVKDLTSKYNTLFENIESICDSIEDELA